MRRFIHAKLHGLAVTEAVLNYHGSATIDTALLEAADIAPYEQVLISNLNNGARWETYVLPGGPGVFAINGATARLGAAGDRCIVMAFQDSERFEGARVIVTNEHNIPVDEFRYPLDEVPAGFAPPAAARL